MTVYSYEQGIIYMHVTLHTEYDLGTNFRENTATLNFVILALM